MPFSPSLAIDLSRFANDAYCAYYTDDELTTGYANLDGSWQSSLTQARWLERYGYALIINPNGRSRDALYFGVVGTMGDAVVVAFRGTSTLNDIAIDVLTGGSRNDSTTRISFPFSVWTVGTNTVWAHGGFLTTYQGLQDSVRATVKQLFDSNASLTKLYVTGHSLGGALATLCSVDLGVTLASDPKVPKPRLWTFASPLVGDQQLATLCNQLTIESYRISETADWVPFVPTRGWTPTWLQWYYAGQHGPEPTPEYEPFVHVGTVIPITTGATYLAAHRLSNYYQGTKMLDSANGNPQLKPSDAVTGLSVRIKTSDALGSGTDNDVFVYLGGVEWGPLDNPGNDFESGSIGTYDLFAMFPHKVPPNLRVQDLDSLTLHLGDGIFYISVWTMAWSPEWVEVTVNGIVFTTIFYTPGQLNWNTSRDVTATITIPT